MKGSGRDDVELQNGSDLERQIARDVERLSTALFRQKENKIALFLSSLGVGYARSHSDEQMSAKKREEKNQRETFRTSKVSSAKA